MEYRRSVVTTGPDGWTWLAASPRGAMLRQTFWSVVLSLLLIVLAATATMPPPAIAVPLVAVVLGVGVLLVRFLWQRSHSAVAVSALGVAVRGGVDTAQIGWSALAAVSGQPVGRRLRIVVETRDARHVTASTFSREPALRWLDTCTEYARSRRLAPRTLDDRPGFRTT